MAKVDWDVVYGIAAVAWWEGDPAELREHRPPSEYLNEAMDFADMYDGEKPILSIVEHIVSRYDGKNSEKIADLISFGLLQY